MFRIEYGLRIWYLKKSIFLFFYVYKVSHFFFFMIFDKTKKFLMFLDKNFFPYFIDNKER